MVEMEGVEPSCSDFKKSNATRLVGSKFLSSVDPTSLGRVYPTIRADYQCGIKDYHRSFLLFYTAFNLEGSIDAMEWVLSHCEFNACIFREVEVNAETSKFIKFAR